MCGMMRERGKRKGEEGDGKEEIIERNKKKKKKRGGVDANTFIYRYKQHPEPCAPWP